MNVLVTGCKGQLGTEMRRLSAEHTKHRYTYVDIDELDLTDGEAVKRLVDDCRIDVIVNCAAFTNVDGAETQEEAARRVNADAVENLARTGRKIIHISTDYIFSGEGWLPYKEDDEPAPRTAYGRTKREGEERLLALCKDAIVFRTAWLYSPWGKNFVKTMLHYGAEKDEMRVVYDQIGSPTYTRDLAVLLADMAATEKYGVYHATNEGFCSWAEFAAEVFRQAGRDVTVTPVDSSAYPTKAVRPKNSRMSKAALVEAGFKPLPRWQDAVGRYLIELQSEAANLA